MNNVYLLRVPRCHPAIVVIPSEARDLYHESRLIRHALSFELKANCCEALFIKINKLVLVVL